MISIEKIKHCKLCFEPIKQIGISDFFVQKPLICERCQNKFSPIFRKFYLEDVKGLAIYEYDQTIREYLFQLKGAYDIEIAPLFLLPFMRYLHFRYRNYILVPAPSTAESNEVRGFNHVKEIFSILKLPMIDVFQKTASIKQVGLSFEQRHEIKNHLSVMDVSSLLGKKVLLIDDVMTTGATLKAMISMLRKNQIYEIKILVLSSVL